MHGGVDGFSDAAAARPALRGEGKAAAGNRREGSYRVRRFHRRPRHEQQSPDDVRPVQLPAVRPGLRRREAHRQVLQRQDAVGLHRYVTNNILFNVSVLIERYGYGSVRIETWVVQIEFKFE